MPDYVHNNYCKITDIIIYNKLTFKTRYSFVSDILQELKNNYITITIPSVINGFNTALGHKNYDELDGE